MAHCNICRSSISSQYRKYDNGFLVCERCYQQRPRCDICSIPLDKYRKVKSKVFCSDCYKNRPRCSICSIPMNGYHYRGDKLFCNDCYEHGNRCEICDIPVGNYYRRNSKLYCPECYSKYPTCSVCQNVTGSYIEFEDFIACKRCEKEITKYKVTLRDARSLLTRDDFLKGQNVLRNVHQPHLCDLSTFTSIRKLSKYISSYTKSDFEYTKECYYFCRTEIEYFREARWSPIECIVTGKGNCSSKSGLLSSLLKARSIKVNFCEIPKHVYIVAHLPDMPKWCRMFASKKKNDGTNWREWMGMDPASNHMIGTIPKNDFTKVGLKTL